MGKKNKNLIIWALTWAVLFLVVAYSPIGRPDLYVNTSYYVSNQGGVSFKTGIANAPKGTGFASTADNNDDAGISSYTPSSSSRNNSEFSGNASKYSLQGYSGSSAATSSSVQQSSSNTAGNILMGYGSSNNQAAQGTATAQDNVSSLTAYGNLSSAANRQSVTHSSPTEVGNGYGGVNEGDDPVGPPIPVGDGLWVLLSMTAVYVIWRQLRATKLKTAQK